MIFVQDEKLAVAVADHLLGYPNSLTLALTSKQLFSVITAYIL